ncbi:MAG TPA: hypothetical protein ENI93_04740 [Gammaproteobacteria bacterium]|nr:hypothetical protein [Gammaproteobacteria bacterium]
MNRSLRAMKWWQGARLKRHRQSGVHGSMNVRQRVNTTIALLAGVLLSLTGGVLGAELPAAGQDVAAPTGVLRVATLNLAHGRKDAFNQLFVPDETIRSNLEEIALVLQRYRPDVVALQEADAPSWWSGSFNHVGYLAERAGMPWRVQARNVQRWFASYGTALISQPPLHDTLSHTFAPSFPTLRKGFVLAKVAWPDDPQGRAVNVASVHLDFARRAVRERQIDELRAVLQVRRGPTIVLGDFNSDALQSDSALRAMLLRSRFSAYRLDAPDLATYKDRRLDWVLISPELRFERYQVAPEVISDHRMVVADIRFRALAPSRLTRLED